MVSVESAVIAGLLGLGGAACIGLLRLHAAEVGTGG